MAAIKAFTASWLLVVVQTMMCIAEVKRQQKPRRDSKNPASCANEVGKL